MRNPNTNKPKPQTTAGRSASRGKNIRKAIDDWYDPYLQEWLAWLSMPRLHTEIFEDIHKTEQIAKFSKEKWPPEVRRDFNRERKQQRQKTREF
jgi:hypothetical protein